MKTRIRKTLLNAILITFWFAEYGNIAQGEDYGKKWPENTCLWRTLYRAKSDIEAFAEKLKSLMDDCKWDSETESFRGPLPHFLSIQSGNIILQYIPLSYCFSPNFDSNVTQTPPDGIAIVIEKINDLQIPLKELRIDGLALTKREFNAICKYIKTHDKLTTVQLSNINISESELKQLYQVLQRRERFSLQLESLNLSENHNFQDTFHRYDKDVLLPFIRDLSISTINFQEIRFNKCNGLLACIYDAVIAKNKKIIPPSVVSSKGCLWFDCSENTEDDSIALGRLLGCGLWTEVSCVEFKRPTYSSLKKFCEAFLKENNGIIRPLGLILKDYSFGEGKMGECLELLCNFPLTDLAITSFFKTDFPQRVPWERLFSNNPFLSSLTISGYNEIPDEFFEKLPNAINLTSFSIDESSMIIQDAKIVKKLIDSLPTLTVLHLPRLSEACSKELADYLESLEERQKKEGKVLFPDIILSE